MRRFSRACRQREQELAAAQSSRLNEAYRTLLSPIERAQYILAQHGVETTESEKLEEPELIMEVLEAREELEDAKSEEDVSNIRQRNQRLVLSNCQLAHTD